MKRMAWVLVVLGCGSVGLGAVGNMAVFNSPPQKSCSGLRLAGRPSKAAFSASYGRRDAGR